MIRLPLRRLRLPGVLGAVGVAAVLAGCGPGIVTEASHQNDVIGTAEVDQTLCVNPYGDASSGQTVTKCGSQMGFPEQPTQFLLAYLVRDDVTAPDTIPSTNDVLSSETDVSKFPEGTPSSPDETVDYLASPSYAAEMQRLYPAPTGQHWTGYISNLIVPAYTDQSGSGLNLNSTATGHLPPDQWDVSPQFALTQPADGPFVGPFSYRTVVGFRYVNPPIGSSTIFAQSADDPVSCPGPATTTALANALAADEAQGLTPQEAIAREADAMGQARGGTATSTGNSFCDNSDDAPAPVTGTTGADSRTVYSPAVDPTANPNTQDTRDLWIGGSAGPSITQGQSGQVPFTLKFAGAQSPDANFALAAADANLPGGTLLAQPATYDPAADSTQTVPVTIAVPDNAPVGPHTVLLTASLPNGQHRSATASYSVAAKPVVVVAPSRSAGRVVISHRFLVRITSSRGERVRLVCPASAPKGCSGSLVLTSRFGSSNAIRFSLAAGKARVFVLKPSGSLLRYLRHHRRGKWVTVTAIATNQAPGTIAATSRRVLHIAPIRPARHPFGVHRH